MSETMHVLILVDLQNDFLPGGALAVRGGDEIIPVVNSIQSLFDLVLATRDWHPAGHGSFASSHPGKKPGDFVDLNGLDQVLWPDHCIQGSRGAGLTDALDITRLQATFFKGTDPGLDSYSAFYDNAHRRQTGLADYLRDRSVREFYICGLATDYCVKYSVLDALRLRFTPRVIVDASRAVNLSPDDGERAIAEMAAAGAGICRSSDLQKLPSR
jgi:nicotinamidase/pyrazinamidase